MTEGKERGRAGHWRLLAVFLTLALFVAACGNGGGSGTTAAPGESTTTGSGDGEFCNPGSAAAKFDEYNALSGQERTDRLVADAQEEGTVIFYTASSGMEPVIDAF